MKTSSTGFLGCYKIHSKLNWKYTKPVENSRNIYFVPFLIILFQFNVNSFRNKSTYQLYYFEMNLRIVIWYIWVSFWIHFEMEMKVLHCKFECFKITPIVLLASMDTSIQPGNLLNVRTKSAKCTKTKLVCKCKCTLFP